MVRNHACARSNPAIDWRVGPSRPPRWSSSSGIPPGSPPGYRECGRPSWRGPGPRGIRPVRRPGPAPWRLAAPDAPLAISSTRDLGSRRPSVHLAGEVGIDAVEGGLEARPPRPACNPKRSSTWWRSPLVCTSSKEMAQLVPESRGDHLAAPSTPMEPVMVPGCATILSAAMATKYPPEPGDIPHAGRSPAAAALWARTVSRQMVSEAT